MKKTSVLILGSNGLLGNTIFKYLYLKNFHKVYGTIRNKKKKKNKF